MSLVISAFKNKNNQLKNLYRVEDEPMDLPEI